MGNEYSQKSILEQGRAAFAYECAEMAATTLKHKSGEYKSYVKRLPMLIKTNGLGSALAFIFSKSSRGGEPDTKMPWGLIYVQLEEWLKRDNKNLIDFPPRRLAKALTLVDSPTYRSVTVEIMGFLTWLRRYSEALIEGDFEE